MHVDERKHHNIMDSFEFFLLCHLLLFGNTYAGAENLKLDLVQVLFRHGARTPIRPSGMCNIADTSAYDPYGFGELTKEGKDQEYQFGSFLRYHYNDFLPATYEPRDVYAYASDMPRTRTSLELVLDGLYPPVGPAPWNSHLKWSRIPYLHTPRNLDTLLGASYKNPKFLRLLLETLRSAEFASEMARFADFLSFVKAKGLISNCSSPLMATGLTYEVLVANEYMRLPLPDWYTTEVRVKFKEFSGFAYDTFAGTREMQRLGAGSLMKTFVGNLDLPGRSDAPKKMYLYAGHDINICLFTRAHGIRELRVPPFGSALILEKLHDSKNRTYLRLLAWDGSGKLETLKLANNEEFCPIEEYLKMIEAMLPSQEETNEMLDELIDDKYHEHVNGIVSNILKILLS